MHGKELPLFDVIGSSLLSPPLAVLLSSYARLVSYNQQDIYIHTYIYIYICVFFFSQFPGYKAQSPISKTNDTKRN